MFGRLKTVISGGQFLKTGYEWDFGHRPVTHRLLGAGCGESRTSGSEGEVRRSNADIDSNKAQAKNVGSRMHGNGHVRI